MNKFTGIVCAVMATFSLTACAQQKTEKQMDNKDSRVLVAYFSATGTTKEVAEELAAVTGGKLYEITPEAPYTDDDLDWHDSNSRSSVEMKDRSSRPAIKPIPVDLDQYDVVFIGFPIWWYTAPTIVNTFIEAHNLQGKKLVPFATSGGSTIEKACKDLKSDYPQYSWETGRMLNNASRSDLENWVDDIAK